MQDTYYDNLNVTRNAPLEVIKAAYKTLAQKNHPDLNPDNPDAVRVMTIINAAYATLSDPEKKRKYDLSLAGRASPKFVHPVYKPAPRYTARTTTSSEYKTTRQPPQKTSSTSKHSNLKGIFKLVGIIIFIFGAVGLYDAWRDKEIKKKTAVAEYPKPNLGTQSLTYGSQSPTQKPEPTTRTSPSTVASRPIYTKPLTAPNGNPWPTTAAYIQGYDVLHRSGLSALTVDNSQNNSSVHVRLWSLDAANPYAVRNFFIPAYSSFTVDKLSAGNYDVRYRDMDSGTLTKSEQFILKEIKQYDGIQYSNVSMTLYKVQNGNMQTTGINESEF